MAKQKRPDKLVYVHVQSGSWASEIWDSRMDL